MPIKSMSIGEAEQAKITVTIFVSDLIMYSSLLRSHSSFFCISSNIVALGHRGSLTWKSFETVLY